VTFADADCARPEAAWTWMMAAYFCPFCSSAIFFAAGVVPLKNASQSALIWASADAVDTADDAADADAGDGAADAV
jgi:hypothetical protein